MNDLIIIGAGPGGYELAIKVAKAGLKVILCEKKALGGVCLNRGCIPTKTFFNDAKIISQMEKLSEFSYTFDFNKIIERKNAVIENLRSGIAFSLNHENIKIVYGIAKLTSKNSIIINDEKYEAKYIVIATGAKSRKLQFEGSNEDYVLTDEEFLNITEVPQNLAIIGGGVVGLEIGSIFHQFGSKVIILEAEKEILPFMDSEIKKRYLNYLKKDGIDIITNAKVEKIKDHLLYYNDEETLYCDYALIAAGKIPNIANLGIEEIGIELNGNKIKVDENFQTNIPNIYAIGDVVGKMMLAHYATYSGYRVLNHILNIADEYDFKNIPSCIFTFPEVSTIGLSEEDCKKQEKEYTTKKAYFRINGKAHAINELDGFIKVIIVNDVIVGAHIIGADANILIHELAIFIYEKTNVHKIKNYIHAHPTLSELISNLF